jgi:predicted cobalt transporter CbtA
VKGGKITEAVEDAVEGLPGLIDGWWSEVSALAHEADHGLVPWEDVAVSAGRFTTLAQAAETFTEDWAKRTGWIRRATTIGENFGRVMGYAGIVGDAFTIYDPPDKGVLGNVDRGVAFVNAGLVAANMFDEVPVVGQVIMVGTGVYLGGTYAYHHWRWFHDACDTIGHGVSSAWHWMTS